MLSFHEYTIPFTLQTLVMISTRIVLKKYKMTTTTVANLRLLSNATKHVPFVIKVWTPLVRLQTGNQVRSRLCKKHYTLFKYSYHSIIIISNYIKYCKAVWCLVITIDIQASKQIKFNIHLKQV